MISFFLLLIDRYIVSKATALVIRACTSSDPILTRLWTPFWRTVNSLEFLWTMGKLAFFTVRTVTTSAHERSTELCLVEVGISARTAALFYRAIWPTWFIVCRVVRHVLTVGCSRSRRSGFGKLVMLLHISLKLPRYSWSTLVRGRRRLRRRWWAPSFAHIINIWVWRGYGTSHRDSWAQRNWLCLYFNTPGRRRIKRRMTIGTGHGRYCRNWRNSRHSRN